MIECPYCGYDRLPEAADNCPRCGLPLKIDRNAATRILTHAEEELGIARWGTAGFNSHTDLVLKVQHIDKTFIFDAEQISELMMGRVDPDSGEVPIIDLTNCGAVDKGVSRRHAKIVRRDSGTLNLIDEESDNGTFLNGQRLVPRQPRILRDGDEIRLGFLLIHVHFRKN